MHPPRMPPTPRNVQLKHSVDIQLAHAFEDQQWTTAANLARQRHKSTKDEYYKAVEAAAKSRGDNTADRTAARDVVRAMVDDNTTIKDVDALDLYEFAIAGLSMDYAKTIGILRSRLTKALPKDQNSGRRCFEACMWNSDWENAQEIAVSLSKNFPGDRKFLFYNIVTTYLVASADTTDRLKKMLFPNLVKAQADRAFNLRPLTGKEKAPLNITGISELEVNLWLRIRENFGSAEENLKLLSRPDWGPLYFIERGLIGSLLRSIILLIINGQWEEIIKVGNIVFDKVISFGPGDPSTALLAAEEHYLTVSREWILWTSVFHASQKVPDRKEALKAFHKRIKKVINSLTNLGRMDPVFQNNYDLILLEIAFERAVLAAKSPDDDSEHNVVPHLVALAKKHLHGSDCFVKLKPSLGLLDKAKIFEFVTAIRSKPTEGEKGVNMFDTLLLVALRLKVLFLQATSLTATEQCIFCKSITKEGPDCETCLKSITECALDAFCAGVQDKDAAEKASQQSEDPLANIALIGSICLIKLAGAGRNSWQYKSPLYNTNTQLFLQAVLWLDFYNRLTPKNDSLRLVLGRLYLMMGCVGSALKFFKSFDIKNSLLESLGLIYLDRLGSISPGHFVLGTSHFRTLAEPLKYHFEAAIGKRYPDTMMKALQAGSYEAVSGLIHIAQKQNRSCALVLSVVESRRGVRLKTGRIETPIVEEPLIGALSPDFELEDRTDYNSLPQWTGPKSTSIQELTAYGPLPTSRRCHLSILAELFLDLVCYVQPKDFKPTKATQLVQVDWQAAAKSCESLHTNLISLLLGGQEDHHNDLTPPEIWHYRTVALLVRVVKSVLKTILTLTSTQAARGGVVETTKDILVFMKSQAEEFLAIPKGTPAKMNTLQGIAALHAMSMLRDSSIAIKYTVQYLSVALDRTKTTDKSRGTAVTAWLTPETKKLVASAAAADACVKERIKTLADNMNTSGWVDRLSDWAFGDHSKANENFGNVVAGKLGCFVPVDSREVWAADVADSWREVVRGWQGVRLD